jgi:superfamily II DNA/RNA helicase
MLVYIQKQPPMLGHPEVEAEGPYAVVLAPTRELAQQVRGMAAAWLYHAYVTIRLREFASVPGQCHVLAWPPSAWSLAWLADVPAASYSLRPCCYLHLQIEEETRNLAHYTDYRVVSVVGGQSIEDQGFLLR